jgi:hypothetical protein
MDIQLQNQLKRLVEVTALVGLSLHAHREARVVAELEKFAFPNELAEKINSDPTRMNRKRVKRDYFGMTEDDYDANR